MAITKSYQRELQYTGSTKLPLLFVETMIVTPAISVIWV